MRKCARITHVRIASSTAMSSLLVLVAVLVAAAASGVEYRQFHVESEIINRYSTTVVTSVVSNTDNVSQELSFRMLLPETAFISNFTMHVNGITYHGVARDKESAAVEYEGRQEQGENVGLVESRGTNLFEIRVNTAASSTATFQLVYEELLIRRKSKYRQVINLNPGSVVEDLQVTVHAIEQQGVADTSASENISIEKPSEQDVYFTYSPSPGDQSDTESGLARDLVVEYDVKNPTPDAGMFVINDCYFVQFFAPAGFAPLPVDVVFVIDVSGSMAGRKIEQTRQALETIINQLRDQDFFNIVTFNSDISDFRSNLIPARFYRPSATTYARSLRANGGTNFNEAVRHGASLLIEYGWADHIQLLIVMTDGVPTVGVTSSSDIISNVRAQLAETSISLNCLGLGEYVDFELLSTIAIENRGTARRIYEGADTAAQLVGLLEEISSPILSEIAITYEPGSTEIMSITNFPLLFEGSEIVVAGKFSNCSETNITKDVSVTTVGTRVNQRVTFQSRINTGENTAVAGKETSTDRLVAYLFIQQLLDKYKTASSESEAAQTKQEIVEMALKYNFVTKFTSLLVVEGRDKDEESSGLRQPLQPFIGDPATVSPPQPGTRLYDAPTTQPPVSTQPPVPTQPLQIHFFNDSPRVIGNDRIEAWFRVSGPLDRVTCYLTGEFYSPGGISAQCNRTNHVIYNHLKKDKYTFKVVAVSGSEREARTYNLDVGYGPTHCYAHWINQGVTVQGNTMTAEFAGVGGYTSLQCKIDQQDYYPCTSPQHLRNLAPGSHKFRVKPFGCTNNLKVTQRFDVQI